MKTTTSLRLAAAGWLAWLGSVHPSAGWAQPVVYAAPNAAGAYTLRVLNSDGSGDRVIPVALPEVRAISFSKDGRFMALTSQEPGRPAQNSKNVFLLNLQTAQLLQITDFEDVVTEDTYRYVTPRYCALTPDNAYIAIWNFVATSGGTAPSLDRYRVSDGLYQTTLALELPLTGNNEAGNGVDYHPTQALLVAARRADVPLYNYYTGLPTGAAGEGTALVLYATDWQQLTFPIGWQSDPYRACQQDYAPAFSPNGQQVAYVRALNLSWWFSPQYWVLSLRIVNVDRSNDHEILVLPQGVYVTRVSWSPDGTQLVFDAGTQMVGSGFPIPYVEPASDALYIVSTNGTGQRLLHAASASCPVWSPPGTTFCNLPGVVGSGGVPGSGTIDDCGQPIHVGGVVVAPGQFRLNITGGMPNLLYRIMASPDLKTWQSLGTLPYAGPTTSFTDSTCGDAVHRFYRIALGNN